MKSNQTYLFLFVAILVYTSCSKSLPDSNGNTLDRVVNTNAQGQTVAIIRYHYNSMGKPSEIIAVPTGVSPSPSTDKFEYDGQGRLAKYTYSNNITGPQFYYNFIYDVNNRVIRKIGTALIANLAVDDFSYGYDAQGRIVSDSAISGSTIHSYRVYTYDNNNQIIGYEQFRKSGGSFASDGKVNIQSDNKQNPYDSFGNVLFLSSGDYSCLSPGNFTSKTPANGELAPGYEYYRNGLLRKRKAPGSQSEYFYMQP